MFDCIVMWATDLGLVIAFVCMVVFAIVASLAGYWLGAAVLTFAAWAVLRAWWEW